MLRSFVVVAGRSNRWNASSGVCSVRFDDNDQDDQLRSNEWPFEFSFVTAGMRFKGVVKEAPHERFGMQYYGVSLEAEDVRLAVTLRALGMHLPSQVSKKLGILVKKFGTATPDRLSAASCAACTYESLGVGKEAAKTIVKEFENQQPAIRLATNFPPLDAKTAFKYIGKVTVHDVEADPYVLVRRKPNGLGIEHMLQIADCIAMHHLQTRVDATDQRRLYAFVRAAIKYLRGEPRLIKACGTREVNLLCGSIWMPKQDIVDTAMNIQMRVDENIRANFVFSRADMEGLFECVETSPLAVDDGKYTLKEDCRMEEMLADGLLAPSHNPPDFVALQVIGLFDTLCEAKETDEVKKRLDEICPHWESLYDMYTSCDATQRSVCRLLTEKHVICLVGAAGTGKSTTLALAVEFANRLLTENMRAVAYTGKAVHRLKQIVSADCRTMHSEIASNKVGSGGTALAIDEVSMASPYLTKELLQSARACEYIILCGDDNQLPSIDPGMMLRDVLGSGVIATLRLTKIYRSGPGSGIATESPKIFGVADKQLAAVSTNVNGFEICLGNNYQPSEKQQQFDDAVAKFTELSEKYGSEHVQMLSNTGSQCDKANKALQYVCNPNHLTGEFLTRKLETKARWIVGDRVINTDNIDSNFDKETRIYNGMMGIIMSVDKEKDTFDVDFQHGKMQRYKSTDTHVDHAYCVTAWKYQGSEIKAVVILLHSEWQVSCEMLYTCMTRGQLTATLYTSRYFLLKALSRRENDHRETRLLKRLHEAQTSRKRSREEENMEDDEDAGEEA